MSVLGIVTSRECCSRDGRSRDGRSRNCRSRNCRCIIQSFGTDGGIIAKQGSSLKCTIGSKNITKSQAASLGRFKL
jgi:hypothetical protein